MCDYPGTIQGPREGLRESIDKSFSFDLNIIILEQRFDFWNFILNKVEANYSL